MIITILNGDMEEAGDFSVYTEKLSECFSEEHMIRLFHLRKMNLHYCTGCWSCWWKTPGKCSIKDDAELIFDAVINSDLVLMASPLKAGFTTSELKKITDRLIVLLHPYIEIKQKECHHRKRYEKYPEFGLLLARENDTDDEDIKIVKDIYDRFALNFHSRIKYLMFVESNSPEEIMHETCHN